MKKFNVVIPVADKDIDFVGRVVDYVYRCVDAEGIIILTSMPNINKLSKKIKKFPNCDIVNEDRLIPGLTFGNVKRLLSQIETNVERRSGWYFQQLLKFGFARSKYALDYYVTWDADTLPLAPIEFFDGDHILFNSKNEYNPNYFKTIEKLFGYGKQAEYSFISEHMMFSTNIVNELIEEIEHKPIKGENWVEKVLYACDFSSAIPAFSEFETYGSYCLHNYNGLYKERHLNTFREGGLIAGRFISEKKLKLLSFDVDVASFEEGHQPMFPYNIPHIWRRIKKIFHYSPSMVAAKIWKKVKREKDEEMEKLEKMIYRLPPKKY